MGGEICFETLLETLVVMGIGILDERTGKDG